MSGVFINYRSDDDSYAAPLLDDHLRAVFGDKMVFKDSRSIEPGMEFPPVLWSALMNCKVLLVLIGRRWLTLAHPDGTRRIDHPDDYVRREIEAALLNGTTIIPIVLDGADLPPVDELPGTIRRLPLRQAMRLRQRESGIDLPAIVAELSKAIPPKAGATATPSQRRGNFGPGGVYFERDGVYVNTLTAQGDVIHGDKNVRADDPD